MVTQLSTADLDHGMPGLLAGTSVVALVPATELRGWAAEMAWAIARAAAAGGRRTVLVDCFVNAPTLGGNREGDAEGLVDAFEYGASLNRIVQQQPQADLFFIPAGTYSSDAEPLMQHPRWKRLSAGFRHEDALLLLYVAAEHLAGLAAEPDGIIVLAPQGLETAAADAPALAEAVGRGTQLIAVVAEVGVGGRGSGIGDARPEVARVVADPRPLSPDPGFSDPRPQTPDPVVSDAPRKTFTAYAEEPSGGFAWGTWMTLVLLLAAVAGGAWWMIERRQAAALAVAEATADSVRLAARAAARAALPPVPPVESLPYAVQVASLPRLGDAYTVADSLAAHAMPAMIAPVRLPGRGTVYRIYAGPFARTTRADSALAALRADGTLAPGSGAVMSVPLSLALGGAHTRAGAVAEKDRLRGAGVPAFILGQADGTFRLYAGAYDAGAQASLLQDLLTPTGGAGELGPRAGYVP